MRQTCLQTKFSSQIIPPSVTQCRALQCNEPSPLWKLWALFAATYTSTVRDQEICIGQDQISVLIMEAFFYCFFNLEEI